MITHISFPAPSDEQAEPYQIAYHLAHAVLQFQEPRHEIDLALRVIFEAAQRDLGLAESWEEFYFDVTYQP